VLGLESLSSNEEFQLFGVIYTLRNSIRRSILEAFAEKETLTGKEIYQYLKKKGLVKTKKGHSPKKIRDYHFPPLIETGMLKELKDNLFEITSFGKDISKSINKFEEFRKLSPLRHRGLHREFILLELRKAKKTFGELKSKLDSLQLRQIIKRLKDSGFLKVIHPYDLLQITSLSYFIISPYYWFIKAVKDFIEKTKRSWFTEYSIITHLAIFWKEKFGRL
jgi:predicted transcriptional regulator